MGDLRLNPARRIIVGAVIALGRELGIDVVAEGVEDLEVLRGMDCPFGQVFTFSRPLPKDHFKDFLARTPTDDPAPQSL